jgi:excisionase family DNA binding protein
MSEAKLAAVKETCHMLGGISAPTLYKMLREGKLDSIKIGRRRMITIESIERFLSAPP